MGTSEATNQGANEQQNQSAQNQQNQNQQNQQGERQNQQQQNTKADRPRSEWTEDDWNNHINRLLVRETEKAVNAALAQREQEAEQAAREQRGEHEGLLREARSEIKGLKKENNLLRARTAVEAAARNAKAHEPGAVFDMISSRIEFNAEGQPTNVDELLERLTSQYPRMFGAIAPRGIGANGGERGDTQSGAQGSSMNAAIRGAIQHRRGFAQQE
jgi:hypothetical protein